MTLLGEKMWSISQIDKGNYKDIPYLCHFDFVDEIGLSSDAIISRFNAVIRLCFSL